MPNAECRLKSPNEMSTLFWDAPELLRNTEEVVERCAFDFNDSSYQFPDIPYRRRNLNNPIYMNLRWHALFNAMGA